VLRVFRACYLALPINCIIMGWVTHAMATIVGLTLGVDKWQATAGLFALAGAYSALAGLWGVVVADAFQFVLAMVGSVALAVFALDAVGGLGALRAQLVAAYPDGAPLALLPDPAAAWMPALTFFVYVAVNWWASWYPGAEPGGGGYVAQRILAAKDERHAFLAALWFNLAHYVLRPWPWILVALCSMLLYPGLANPEEGYVLVLVDHLPPAWRGLLLAAFFAAYMSTISTHLNWGAAYLLNDVYRRHLRPEASPAHYARVGRAATVGLMAVSGVITYYLSSVEGAWKFLLAIGAGTGLVYLLRWYWWRINAWSEIAAMSAAFVLSLVLQLGVGFDAGDPRDFAYLMLLTVAGTTVVWLLATFWTPPEPTAHLRAFCDRVRPGGPGWRAIVGPGSAGPGLRDVAAWAAGCVIVYLGLFGTGELLLGRAWLGAVLLAVAGALTAWVLSRGEPRGRS
jgi:solute:Na+ symporter, SSS family